MTERMIENRIKKLTELGEQITKLQEQADAIKGELKAELEEKGIDELKTKNFLIKWKGIVSSRLDGKALKAKLLEIYNQYCKVAEPLFCDIRKLVFFLFTSIFLVRQKDRLYICLKKKYNSIEI